MQRCPKVSKGGHQKVFLLLHSHLAAGCSASTGQTCGKLKIHM